MESIESNELVQMVETIGLESQTAITLKEKFYPFFAQVLDWKNKAESLVVTDINQTKEMKMAREARLALRQIRINADKTRIALKEDSNRYGKAVQSIYNMIEKTVSPIEDYLEKQEKFIEIQQQKRKDELRHKRSAEALPYAEYMPFGIDLGDVTEDEYQSALNYAKKQHEDKIEADKKAELERIAREKAEAEERERMRIENERLRAEALEREKQMQKERAIAEAKLKAEREEKARIEAELRAKTQQVAIESKPQTQSNIITDREALEELANKIENMYSIFPNLQSDEAKKISDNAKTLLNKVSKYIRENAEKIDFFN